MTWFEKIKNMSEDEMVELINDVEEIIVLGYCSKQHCEQSPENGLCKGISQGACKAAIKNFLRSEAK